MNRTNPYLLMKSSFDSGAKTNRRFHIQSLQGEEAICRDFSFTLNLSTLEKLTQTEIDRLLGDSITVDICYTDQKQIRRHRYLNGIVYHLEELGLSRAPHLPDLWQYQVEIGSWFRKLDFIGDCRLFQKSGNTGVQLIGDLLREYECYDFRDDTRENLPRKELTVIYRETVGQFILRQLRENNLVWRFEHHENKHVLVVGDDSTTFPVISALSLGRQDAVRQFCPQVNHSPLKEHAEAAFDWENPPVKQVQRGVGDGKGRLSQFIYSGRFTKREEGEKKIGKHGQALENRAYTCSGASTVRAFTAGHSFTLHAPILTELHGESFLITRLKIEATDQTYTNSFVVQPAKQPYFPANDVLRDTPGVPGPQTAVVVGAGDSGSVQTDRLGRVKVRFRWDHHTPDNSGNTSAYLRVAMPAAGAERGFLFNPRVGEEVVVDFEDGNPEKPIIIGSVYSKHNPPPFAPNTQPYRSMIRNSSRADSNQVVFDDQPGRENLELVAKKELTLSANHNLKIDVKKDITVDANAMYVIAKSGVELKAGKDIQTMSLVTILNIAAMTATHSAGSNIINAAAAIVLQGAGAILTNLAGMIYANTSVLGITQATEGKIDNVSSLLVLNTASSVVNAGENTVENKAALAILNQSGSDLVNKGGAKKSKSLMSMTEAETFVVSGDTTVGPV